MTDKIHWKSEYETGNVMVDREHRELVNLVNLLLSLSRQEHGGNALHEAFSALERYAQKHFRDEEDLLKAVGSSHLEIQKAQHGMISCELRTLWKDDADTPSNETLRQLVQWAEYRLLKHFLTYDFRAFHDDPFVEN